VQSWSRQKPPRTGQPFWLLASEDAAIQSIGSLCAAIGVDRDAILPQLPEDPTARTLAILAAGKLIAAHYRRLWRLLDTNRGFEFVSVKVEQDAEVPSVAYEDEDEDDTEP